MSPEDIGRLERKLAPYPVILMDMDNTIYDQRDYDRGAFLDIARALFPGPDEKPPRSAFAARLLERKEALGPYYANLFDDALKELESPRAGTAKLVAIYHAHDAAGVSPERSLQPLIRSLSEQRRKVFLVTNGRRKTQMRKISRLELKPWLAGIYIGGNEDPEYPPKPDPAACLRMLDPADKRSAVMVGDSESVDGGFAENSGIPFIRQVYRSRA